MHALAFFDKIRPEPAGGDGTVIYCNEDHIELHQEADGQRWVWHDTKEDEYFEMSDKDILMEHEVPKKPCESSHMAGEINIYMYL